MAPTDRHMEEPQDAIQQDGSKATATTSGFPVAGDLVLRDEEGRYFLLKKAEYEASRIPPDAPSLRIVTSQIERLTQQGVLLADVPKGVLGGIGLMCKLINLAGIRSVKPKPPEPARVRPSERLLEIEE